MKENSGLAERIKRVRKSKSLTQSEFGSMVGVKGNTVTGYENGTRVPSDSVINNICKTFEINETWLRTGDPTLEMDLSASSGDGPLEKLFINKNCSKLEMVFLNGYFSLNEKERTEFCRLIAKMFPAVGGAIGGDPLETIWQDAPSIAPVPDDIDALAERAADLYRDAVVSEKKQASQASSAKESGVG